MSDSDRTKEEREGRTDQVGPAERGSFQETGDCAEEVEVPVLGNATLGKGNDGPKDLQCGEQEGCTVIVSVRIGCVLDIRFVNTSSMLNIG